jgi:GrpB-like predicted nucleotidyltransferase (UPF0157 family)
MRVNVVPYDPNRPATFETLRAELAEILQDVEVLAIEHVGSTAVPGLEAKPVIDVDVVVSRDQLDSAIRVLESSGYRHRGDLAVRDRHAMAAPGRGPRRHVYVVVDGCLALRNHLGVRDVLRADSKLREQYGRLKQELAGREFDSANEYVSAKSDLLLTILEKAGIGPAERAKIRNINRADTDNSHADHQDPERQRTDGRIAHSGTYCLGQRYRLPVRGQVFRPIWRWTCGRYALAVRVVDGRRSCAARIASPQRMDAMLHRNETAEAASGATRDATPKATPESPTAVAPTRQPRRPRPALLRTRIPANARADIAHQCAL